MTVPQRIDLHTHSTVSDGTDAPRELIRAARAARLDVVALTDHDTWDGIEEAAEEAAGVGPELVVGVEISCSLDGRSVHLLGYGGDRTDPTLVAELARIRQGRSERLPTMLSRLAALGMPLTEADVAAFARDTPSIGRPHVADAMVAAGYVADRDEAFASYLAEGGPAYVDRYSPDVFAAIRLLVSAGGVPVVAHPWGRGSREVLDTDVLDALIQVGLAGWEADHVDHQPQEREELRRHAARRGVLATGSSDYHGTGKTRNPLGVCLTDLREYSRLREMLVG